MIKNPLNMRIIRSCLIAGMLAVSAINANAAPETHTDLAAFTAALAGYGTLPIEDFEGDAWAASRSPLSTLQVKSQGILWTSNFTSTTPPNEITTVESGLLGSFALFSNPSGNPDAQTTGCEVEDPIPIPELCFLHDGFVGTSDGAGTLYGVGAWINGTSGAEAVVLLDGVEVGFGVDGIISGWTFLGVTDTEGFNAFEFREINGKSGQVFTIRADDVTLGVSAVPIPAAFWLFGSGLLGLVGIARRKKT